MMASPELDDFCRLCLRLYGALQMQPVKSSSENFGQEHVTIPDMMVVVCGLSMHPADQFPQRICGTCVNRLEETYRSFREFKEKETLLERFYFCGSMVQRLCQYQNFRYTPPDANEAEKIASPKQETERPPSEIEPLDKENTSVVSDSVTPVIPDDSDSSEFIPESYVKTQMFKKKKPVNTRQLKVKTRAGRKGPEHDGRTKFIQRPDGLYQCMQCKRLFEKRHSCRQHCYGHDALRQGRYSCRFCNRNFRKKYTVNLHEEKIHLKPARLAKMKAITPPILESDNVHKKRGRPRKTPPGVTTEGTETGNFRNGVMAVVSTEEEQTVDARSSTQRDHSSSDKPFHTSDNSVEHEEIHIKLELTADKLPETMSQG